MSSIEIVEILRTITNDNKVQLKELSQKANMEYQRVVRIFNNRSTMSASELLTFCNVLDISPDIFRSA